LPAKDDRRLDPEGHYSPEDLVVSSDVDLPAEGGGRLSDQLPAREIVYRLVRERGGMTLAELSREFSAIAPSAVRPPYAQEPEIYVLRLVAGDRAGIPPLADFQAVVRHLAEHPPDDADYGLTVRPG
jgi:hypothetical protein